MACDAHARFGFACGHLSIRPPTPTIAIVPATVPPTPTRKRGIEHFQLSNKRLINPTYIADPSDSARTRKYEGGDVEGDSSNATFAQPRVVRTLVNMGVLATVPVRNAKRESSLPTPDFIKRNKTGPAASSSVAGSANRCDSNPNVSPYCSLLVWGQWWEWFEGPS